jgi:hypothetical protein
MIEALAKSDAEVVSLAQLWQAKQEAHGWCTPSVEHPTRLALATS